MPSRKVGQRFQPVRAKGKVNTPTVNVGPSSLADFFRCTGGRAGSADSRWVSRSLTLAQRQVANLSCFGGTPGFDYAGGFRYFKTMSTASAFVRRVCVSTAAAITALLIVSPLHAEDSLPQVERLKSSPVLQHLKPDPAAGEPKTVAEPDIQQLEALPDREQSELLNFLAEN